MDVVRYRRLKSSSAAVRRHRHRRTDVVDVHEFERVMELRPSLTEEGHEHAHTNSGQRAFCEMYSREIIRDGCTLMKHEYQKEIILMEGALGEQGEGDRDTGNDPSTRTY